MKKFDGNFVKDEDAKDLLGTMGAACSYYRPSGGKGFFVYNGVVQCCLEVQFPSGKRKRVVSVN